MGCSGSKDDSKKEKPANSHINDKKNNGKEDNKVADNIEKPPAVAETTKVTSDRTIEPAAEVHVEPSSQSIPPIAIQSSKASARKTRQESNATPKSMSRAGSLSNAGGAPSSTMRRHPRTSAEYFEGALPRYPNDMRARMQATRKDVTDIPANATPYVGMELSETHEGIMIESVAEGGPAHIIGILPGDMLTGIGATAITPSTRLARLAEVIKETCRVGRVVPVRFSQNGVEVEAPLWIMTTDADLDGRPYFFNPLVNRVVARRRSTVRAI